MICCENIVNVALLINLLLKQLVDTFKYIAITTKMKINQLILILKRQRYV